MSLLFKLLAGAIILNLFSILCFYINTPDTNMWGIIMGMLAIWWYVGAMAYYIGRYT